MIKLTEWYENQDFWEQLASYMFDDKRLARTDGEVAGIIKLLHLEKNDTVLDMGCGMGRHLIGLALRGYRKLIGIDTTKSYLEIARRDAEQQGLEVVFEFGDMKNYHAKPKASKILSLFSSFGYFENHEDNLQVLRNMYENLELDGQLLVDVRSKENFIKHFDEHGRVDHEDGTILVTERSASDDFSKITNTWKLLRPDGSQATHQFVHWAYGAHELVTMFQQVGFSNCRTYGGFSGSTFSPDSSRLIVIGKK